jgi:hypothetical protein
MHYFQYFKYHLDFLRVCQTKVKVKAKQKDKLKLSLSLNLK